MKKNQVQIGGTYVANVSGQLTSVCIDAESPYGGWDATNVATRRKVRIKNAQRLRRVTRIGRPAAAAEADAPPEESMPPEPPTSALADAAEDAAAAQDGDDGRQYDPSRCATPDCETAPAMTYLGRPLCQVCWDQRCGEQPGEATEPAGNERCPIDRSETPKQENEMSKKTTKKTSKAQPVAANDKGGKKAATSKTKAASEKKPKATAEKKPKRLSALDAAAQVLVKAKEPMRAQDLITAMAEQGLWKSPGGKTPHATLYAAIIREIGDKGKEARFEKVDRGMFAARKA